MADTTWTNTRPCCVMTWSTLALLGELSAPFPGAGKLQLKQLMFWAGSVPGRSARARALSVQMDSTFRDLFGSRYENGVDRTAAIQGMAAELLKGDHTVADLGNTDDDLYFFLGEKS